MTTNASGLAAAKASEDGGLDVIQFDEPTFTAFHDGIEDWGVAALERAAEGQHTAQTAVHICYGYGIEARGCVAIRPGGAADVRQ